MSKVIVLEPNKPARLAEIDLTLETMQSVVGGLIKVTYPFYEPVALVCNAEGKRLHLPMNRPLQHDDGYVYNVVCGTAFICGYGKEDFTSVPDQLIKKYMKMYKIPPVFPTDDTGVFLCI